MSPQEITIRFEKRDREYTVRLMILFRRQLIKELGRIIDFGGIILDIN